MRTLEKRRQRVMRVRPISFPGDFPTGDFPTDFVLVLVIALLAFALCCAVGFWACRIFGFCTGRFERFPSDTGVLDILAAAVFNRLGADVEPSWLFRFGLRLMDDREVKEVKSGRVTT